MSISRCCAVVGVLLLAVSGANANLLVPNSTDDTVVLLSSFDGSVIDPAFLDINVAATSEGYLGSSTPIEALQVGSHIWVSDQIADRIWRFGLDGTYIDSLGVGEVDNIRGMEVVGDTVYVTNGSDGGNQPEGIVTIDATSGMVTGSFAGKPAATTPSSATRTTARSWAI